jgi:hypothetical protein
LGKQKKERKDFAQAKKVTNPFFGQAKERKEDRFTSKESDKLFPWASKGKKRKRVAQDKHAD